jgi:hypothetical protein
LRLIEGEPFLHGIRQLGALLGDDWQSRQQQDRDG